MLIMVLLVKQKVVMIELLNSNHERRSFDCGQEMLNKYLKNQAGQDMKRKLSACFVLTDPEKTAIKGYYTLSNKSIPHSILPLEFRKKLPESYQSIPVTLLGRLAIDKNFQGLGIGKILLIDALKRSFEISRILGSFAVVVDPINSDAEKFYLKYGFIKLPDSEKMLIAMKTLNLLFGNISG